MSQAAKAQPGASGEAVWLALSNSRLTRALANAIAREFDCDVVMGAQNPTAQPVGVVLVDDAHMRVLETAKQGAPEAQQTILISRQLKGPKPAEFVISHRNDEADLLSLILAVREYRRHLLTTSGEPMRRMAAIASLRSGEFSVRTEAEARDLALLLALACPSPNRVAAGLQILLINAIELGNLEIPPDVRKERQMRGTLRREVVKRMETPDFSDRDVRLQMSRTDRMISFVIQNDGPGMGEEELEIESSGLRGDRSPGLALVEELGFANISHRGVGAMIEALILLDPA